MQRVVVTGATGFVGANLTRRLLAEGHKLHLLVRPGSDPWRISDLTPHVELHAVALSDRASVAAVIGAIRPEWIFHLAAHGAYSWQQASHPIVQTNILGTINLVEACLKTGFAAFVNTGSSSEYGFKDHAPDEQTWLEPNSLYAVAKAAATLYCRHIAQRHGVHLVTLRLYSVYGPYEEPRRLLPTLIMHALRGELPPLVNPQVARDYVYTDDVNAAYLLAATRASQEHGAVYNVGSGVQTTLQEVVAVARQQFSIAAAPQWGSLPERAWDTSVWVADNRKIASTLGWQPRYRFAQGFAAMADWLQAHPELHPRYRGEL